MGDEAMVAYVVQMQGDDGTWSDVQDPMMVPARTQRRTIIRQAAEKLVPPDVSSQRIRVVALEDIVEGTWDRPDPVLRELADPIVSGPPAENAVSTDRDARAQADANELGVAITEDEFLDSEGPRRYEPEGDSAAVAD